MDRTRGRSYTNSSKGWFLITQSLKRLFLIWVTLNSVSFLAEPAFAQDLANPIQDNAGIISAEMERELNGILRDTYSSGGPQIAVITLTKLKTGSIEQDSIELVDKLKLGRKDKDDGVLLLIALEDRKMRIEVGQGLEGSLPDIQAGRIIRDSMVPLFKLARFDEAIYLGVGQILNLTYPQAAEKLQGIDRPQRKKSLSGFLGKNIELIFYLLFFVFAILNGLFGRRGRRRGFLGSGGYYGGGGYGGGFGGGGGGFSGGFGGGGGGFSGGGSSGSW
jgi:uncharacterized protein